MLWTNRATVKPLIPPSVHCQTAHLLPPLGKILIEKPESRLSIEGIRAHVWMEGAEYPDVLTMSSMFMIFLLKMKCACFYCSSSNLQPIFKGKKALGNDLE